MLYIGAKSLNSLSLSNAFERIGIEVKMVDPADLALPESRLRRKLRIWIDNVFNHSDEQPISDPIMQGREIRRLRRDHLTSSQSIELINQNIRNIATDFKPDITFLFHYHYIDAETLDLCHKYGPIFCFFPDDAFTPERYTLRAYNAIRRIDCVMSTKSFNISEFYAIGIPVALFVNNSYDPELLHPVDISDEEADIYGCDVSFVGNNYIRDRTDFLAALVVRCPNIKFGIWGNYWNRVRLLHQIVNPCRYWRYRKLSIYSHKPITYVELCKVHVASKINLGLLYAGDGPARVRDYQTTRSIEIPATGGFMLAEYTDEHDAMFKEGVEAAYFHSFDDLVDKIHYYLENDEERIKIAEAGLQRCNNSDYTFDDRARTLINEYNKWCLKNKRPQFIL